MAQLIMPHSDAPTRGDEELAQFLAKRPVLHPVLHEAARRYRSYNGLKGEIRLASLDVQSAVVALGARLRMRGTNTVVQVAELDRAFRATRFAVGLVEVFRILLGAPVLTREAQHLARVAAQEALLRRMREAGAAAAQAAGALPEHGLTAVDAWLAVDHSFVVNLAPNASREDGAAPRTGEAAGAELAARALGAIRCLREPVSVPVLAQQVAGYPHALDADTSAGRLLTRALALTTPEVAVPVSPSADERELLFGAVNLVVDEISSGVTVYNLLGTAPVLAGAVDQNCVVTLPLVTVGELAAATAAHGMAYTVENPAVFMGIVRAVRNVPTPHRPTVICTSGQLSVAARRLLDLIVRGGGHIQYSGDFDAMGLAIARGLCHRWPEAVRLWRMSLPDYEQALASTMPTASREGIPVERLAAVSPAYPELCARLAVSGPAYQEALLPQIIADVRMAMASSDSRG